MLSIKDSIAFHKKVFEVVDLYREAMGYDIEDAMDGDATEDLSRHILMVIDLYQGNTTFSEFLKATKKLEERF